MNPTKADKQLWDAIAQIGCIACIIDGYRNPTYKARFEAKYGKQEELLTKVKGYLK